MPSTPPGKPIRALGPDPLPPLPNKSGSETFGWNLSDEARLDIERIEANVRNAERKIGTVILR